MVLAIIPASASAQRKSRDPGLPLPAGFREIPIPHYLLYTDLGDDDLRAVVVRINHLVAEYESRTREFSEARNDKQLPFFLFSNKEDYYAAGGTRGSSGVFEGDRMMACIGPKADSRAWTTIQHEAFHQYAAMKLGRLPIWVNEGLAEYFGQGIFTGDGFVCGVFPPWRLQRIRAHVAANEFLPLEDLLRYTHDQWNQQLDVTNYDQAWAYIQFLAHGSGAEGQDALKQYIRGVGHGQDSVKAFRASIGEPAEVERRFTQWIADLPDNPTSSLYGQAGVATITSFVARAAARGQVVSSIDELKSLVTKGELLCADDDWIPVQVLEELLPLSGQLGSWSITPASRKTPLAVVLRQHGGTVLRGMFTLDRGRVAKVWVEAEPPAKALPARDSR
jgi:hypothetical protein